MKRFDDYIQSITKGMFLSRKQKRDIEDEFHDHLNMLMKEYIEQGFKEDEAEEMAVKSFGDSKAIRERLISENYKYRSIPNVLVGMILYPIFLFMLFTLLKIHLITHLFLAENTWFIQVHFIIYMSFMGYFMPIFFKRMQSAYMAVLASIFPYILMCAQEFYFISFNLKIDWKLAGSIIGDNLIECIISGIFGYLLLNTVNIITSEIKDRISNRVKA